MSGVLVRDKEILGYTSGTKSGLLAGLGAG